jgi:coproporphyrinogen III oxidase-like Fe-S oxidoreductase
VAGLEELDDEAMHTEDVLLKIRLRQGLPLHLLDASELGRADVAIADGLAVAEDERLVLTDRGRLLADAVVRTLLG